MLQSTKIVGEPSTGNQCNRFDEGGGLIPVSTLMLNRAEKNKLLEMISYISFGHGHGHAHGHGHE
jgi:hypothetical protein